MTEYASHSFNYDPSSYEIVADEYYDRNAHPTCFNFNRLSRMYLQGRLPETWDGEPIIEVGAGDSSVASLLHSRGHPLAQLHITDGSPAMLAHSKRWQELGATTAVSPAHNLDVDCDSYAYLVSSLGDPYNTVDFWSEARRILSREGRLIFTTPSFEWSDQFRDTHSSQKAEFLVGGLRKLELPSFIFPLAVQIDMMQSFGFSVVNFESLGAGRLGETEPLSPKVAIFGSGFSSIVWGFELVKR